MKAKHKYKYEAKILVRTSQGYWEEVKKTGCEGRVRDLYKEIEEYKKELKKIYGDDNVVQISKEIIKKIY
jgi:hypothetical protein